MRAFLLLICFIIGQVSASDSGLYNEKEYITCLNCNKAKEYYRDEDFKEVVSSLEKGLLEDCKSCQFLYGMLALSGAYMFKDTEAGVSLVVQSARQKYPPAVEFLNNLDPDILKQPNDSSSTRIGSETLDKKYLLGGPDHYSFFVK